MSRRSHGFDDVAPDASAMIESMRAHGYTLATALADLIDNSIAAGAGRVWLEFNWGYGDPWIAVVDDGRGMSQSELIDAMRLGSRSPLEKRAKSDLGRFGLGLKTASFSQARRLTVITQPDAKQCFVRRWDLDHLARPDVKGWQLLRTVHEDTGDRAHLLDGKGVRRGTQILLERLDRVVGDPRGGGTEKDRQDHFLWQIDRVREHLEMVFHRFLSRRPRGLSIFLNDEPVLPWDPFLESHVATQPMGSYSQKLGSHSQPVRVRGFVLPHRDRFATAAEHSAAGGPRGWNDHQGFYLFRNDRLIIAGDWLQFPLQKAEHFALARIEVDIPNSMDHEWQIDVKKSTAAPPGVLRAWLKGIAQKVRQQAKQVYAHRGKYGKRGRRGAMPRSPWITKTRPGGEFSYRIDRKHPVLAPLISSLPATERERFDVLLRLIEETLPVRRIWIDTAENQDGAASPFADEDALALRNVIRLCHEAQVRFRGVGSERAWNVVADFEGFQTTEAQAIIGQLRGD